MSSPLVRKVFSFAEGLKRMFNIPPRSFPLKKLRITEASLFVSNLHREDAQAWRGWTLRWSMTWITSTRVTPLPIMTFTWSWSAQTSSWFPQSRPLTVQECSLLKGATEKAVTPSWSPDGMSAM